MSTSNFKNDLQEARAIEVEVAHTLIQKHNHHLIEFAPDKYFPDWDFRYKQQTFEVKFDRQAKTTGNLYIEHKCLNNSKADYFIYVASNDIYVFNTNWLRENIKALEYRYIKYAGDLNGNEGSLVRLSNASIQSCKYEPPI